jgi:hypothetical protein
MPDESAGREEKGPPSVIIIYDRRMNRARIWVRVPCRKTEIILFAWQPYVIFGIHNYLGLMSKVPEHQLSSAGIGH